MSEDPRELSDRIRDNAHSEIDVLMAGLPTYERSLRIWAIRALIALVIAYGIVRFNGGPNWVVPAGWTYVFLSLIISLVTVYFARRMIVRAHQRVDATADRVDRALREEDDDG